MSFTEDANHTSRLERGADLHMAQLMPLPLTVCCFSKIQIGFTFPVPADPGVVPDKGPLNGCVCVCVCGSERQRFTCPYTLLAFTVRLYVPLISAV